MRDKLFRPLGMRGSTFTNEDYNMAVNPSTGGVSTAADYTNFLAMLLNKGTFNNQQILTPASVEMLHTLQVEASKMKYVPKTEEGLNYGLGEWILETNAQGKASTVTVPSLQGTWPMIDLCRGYACVVFTKDLNSEQNRNLYLDIKATIDDEIKGNCE